MDVGINSVVQSLLNVDLGQFSDSLFTLGDRRKKDTSDHEDLVEENSEDDTSVASLPKECCAICAKLSQSPNNIASRRIKECVAQLKISGIVPVISIRRLFLGNLFFLRNNPRIFDFFDGFCFKTVKIIFFLPKNPVLGTVPQKKIVFICVSVVQYSYDRHNNC